MARCSPVIALLSAGLTLRCPHPAGPVSVGTHPSIASVDTIPLSGRPFAVAVAGSNVVYVTALDAGLVARTTVPSETIAVTFAIGAIPSQVRISPNGATAYVNNQDAGAVKVVDVSSNATVNTITVPGSVLTIGLSPNGARLYALTDYRGMYVIDARSGVVIDSISPALLGSILAGVAFHPSLPRMYVAARDAGTVATINTQTNAVMQVDAVNGGNLQNVAVSRGGDQLFATDILRSKLITWDLLSGKPAPTHEEDGVGTPVFRNAFDVALTPDNAQLYVSTLADGAVYVLDRVTRAPITTIWTGGSARYIGFDRLGATAVIPNEGGWVTFVH